MSAHVGLRFNRSGIVTHTIQPHDETRAIELDGEPVPKRLTEFGDNSTPAFGNIANLDDDLCVKWKEQINPGSKLDESKLIALLVYLVLVHITFNASRQRPRYLPKQDFYAVFHFHNNGRAFILRA